MVYSLSHYKNIILGSDTKVVKETTILDESLFSFGLSCIEESDIEIRKIMIDEQLVLESIGSSFIELIKTIIGAFIGIIIKIFSRFKDFFVQLIRSDETIVKYKKELLKFDKELSIFDYDLRYRKYTNFDADIPDPNLYLKFNEEYEDSVGKLENWSKSVSRSELLSKIAQLTNDIDLSLDGKYFTELRAEILKTKKIVKAEDYADTLYRLFRDEEDKEPNPKTDTRRNKFKVSPLMVREACKRFLDSKKMISDVEKQKSTLTNTAQTVIKKFEKLTPDQFIRNDTGKLDYELSNSFETYGRRKAAQLQEMCNICVLAFSAKLDAMKEAAVQDKKICFYAISKIITEGGTV